MLVLTFTVTVKILIIHHLSQIWNSQDTMYETFNWGFLEHFNSLFSLLTSGLILAGMLANSGEEANVVSSSTASVSGLAASAHRWRFSSVKSWSRA